MKSQVPSATTDARHATTGANVLKSLIMQAGAEIESANAKRDIPGHIRLANTNISLRLMAENHPGTGVSIEWLRAKRATPRVQSSARSVTALVVRGRSSATTATAQEPSSAESATARATTNDCGCRTPNQALQQTAGHDSFLRLQAHRCPAAAELGRSADNCMTNEQRWISVGERVSCLLLIAWLQFVGWYAQSIVHHILHATPLVLLLFLPTSSARYLTGMLAGYLWIFMLAGVTSMLYTSLYLGDAFARPHNLGNWLAPVAAALASLWAAFNAAMLANRVGFLVPSAIVWLGLAGVFTIFQPYITNAVGFPLDRVLAGQYLWINVLLLETIVVLAVPGLIAFHIADDLKVSWKLIGWQATYWLFFVVMMVAGLLPTLN